MVCGYLCSTQVLITNVWRYKVPNSDGITLTDIRKKKNNTHTTTAKELHIEHRICCQKSYEEMNVEKKDMSHVSDTNKTWFTSGSCTRESYINHDRIWSQQTYGPSVLPILTKSSMSTGSSPRCGWPFT